MFTGLVQTTGRITARRAGRLLIAPAEPFASLQPGESIAVNGCCLTLERASGAGVLEFFTLAETLRRTNLDTLPSGGAVNLERAMALGERLGGHLVQGHVDACAEVLSFQQCPDGDWELRIALPPELAQEVVLKGSVAIDGVSLTVADLDDRSFAVRLIPETLKRTALQFRTAGARVNLESDVIGKYVRRILELRSDPPAPEKSGKVTYEALQKAGFL